MYHLLPICLMYTEVKVTSSNRVKPTNVKFFDEGIKQLKSMHVLWWEYGSGVK